MQLMESKREERVILMLSENCLTMDAIVLVIVSILFKMCSCDLFNALAKINYLSKELYPEWESV